MAAVAAAALRLKLPLTAVVATLLFLAAGPIADAYGHESLTWPLRLIAVALIGQSLAALLGGMFVAQGRVALNLRLVFTGGDPAIHSGLNELWKDRANWPEPAKQQSAAYSDPEVWAFIQRAMAASKK